MMLLFLILVILGAVILGLIVLIQNPKGGGLSGNLAGFSNQFMGVKQTTDVLEKGTWLFAGVVGILCMLSPLFIDKAKGGGGSSAGEDLREGIKPAKTAPAAPANPPASNVTTPLPGAKDTTK